jgi:acyl-CoA thioesterase
MLSGDAFSKWLGIEVAYSEPDHCMATLVVRPEMLNGFHVTHGGIAMALADSVLAFAANYTDFISLVLDSTVHFAAPTSAGDLLEATATCVYKTKRTAVYDVLVVCRGKLVMTTRGTVYKTDRPVIG